MKTQEEKDERREGGFHSHLHHLGAGKGSSTSLFVTSSHLATLHIVVKFVSGVGGLGYADDNNNNIYNNVVEVLASISFPFYISY